MQFAKWVALGIACVRGSWPSNATNGYYYAIWQAMGIARVHPILTGQYSWEDEIIRVMVLVHSPLHIHPLSESEIYSGN